MRGMWTFVLEALLGVLLLPAIAAADAPRYHTDLCARIDDSDQKITAASLAEAVRAPDKARLDACWKKPGGMTVKLVLDRGQVASAVVIQNGNGDRAEEACVLKVLRAIKLKHDAGRVTATIELHGQRSPTVGFFCSGPKVLYNVVGENRSSAPAREVEIDVRQPPRGAFGDRTGESIQHLVVARAGVWRACYQQALNHTPDIAGKLTVRFSISTDGQVSRALVDPAGTTLASESASQCVTSNIMRLKYPPSRKVAEVIYSFQFSSRPASASPARSEDGAPAGPVPAPPVSSQPGPRAGATGP